MYRFEWNYKGIKDGKSFEKFVDDIKNKEIGEIYEQAARLFYNDEKGTVVMIELQVPTKDLIDQEEEIENPWLDGYLVKHMEDYDTSMDIYTGIGSGEEITYNNAEQLMLTVAKELCKDWSERRFGSSRNPNGRNSSVEELISQGYSSCGRCKP